VNTVNLVRFTTPAGVLPRGKCVVAIIPAARVVYRPGKLYIQVIGPHTGPPETRTRLFAWYDRVAHTWRLSLLGRTTLNRSGFFKFDFFEVV
jgi:hypothetical protein